MRKNKLILSAIALFLFVLSCKKMEDALYSSTFNEKTIETKTSISSNDITDCGGYIDPTDTLGRVPYYFDDYAQCRTLKPKWWPDFSHSFTSTEIEEAAFNTYSLTTDLDDFVVKNIIKSYLYSDDVNSPGLGNGRSISTDEQRFLDLYFEERISKILSLRAEYPYNSMFDLRDGSLIELYRTFEAESRTSSTFFPTDFFGKEIDSLGNAKETYGTIPNELFANDDVVDSIKYNFTNRPLLLYYNLNLNRYYYYLFIKPSDLANAMTLTTGPVDN